MEEVLTWACLVLLSIVVLAVSARLFSDGLADFREARDIKRRREGK